ncbi:hypothetical protein AM420_005754 [Klebsiella pneumoniae]|nr:hypothetical protein AM420_005754 [Klebsiella pneumoniae]
MAMLSNERTVIFRYIFITSPYSPNFIYDYKVSSLTESIHIFHRWKKVFVNTGSVINKNEYP